MPVSSLRLFSWVFGSALALILAATAQAQVTLTSGQVDVAYAYAITTTPAAPTGTVYGATNLPTGLSINSNTGIISGTPKVAGTSAGVISLTAGGVVNNLSYTLVIAPALGTPVISSSATASGRVGDAFTYTVAATNSPTSFNVGSLPPGLSFNAATSQIAGTPTSAGTTSVPLSANNTTGTGAITALVITIDPAGPVPVVTAGTASGALGAAFTYDIVATNSPVSYSATGLPLGLTLNSSTGRISGIPTVAGVTTVVLTATNNNGTSAPANLVLTLGPVSTISSGLSLPLALDRAMSPFTLTATNSPVSFNVGTLPAGLSVNTTTGVISGTPTAAGTTNVSVSANNATGVGPAATLVISVGATPAITSAVTASGVVGDPFAYTVTASGTPTSFAAANLPGGLTLNTTSGAITGSPTATGTFSISLTAANTFGPGAATTLTLTVGARPAITSPTTATAVVGTAFNYTVTATNSPTGFSASGLPSGLTLNPTSGAITGTPTSAGTASVSLTAANAFGTSSATTLAIVVSAPATGGGGGSGIAPSLYSSPSDQTVVAGSPVTLAVYAFGSAPLTFQWLKDGSAVAGATSASLTLSTAALADTGSYNVIVRNVFGSATSQAARLTVTEPVIAPLITSNPASASVTTGSAVSFRVTATGTAPLSYQWRRDGAVLTGATSATLSLASAAAADAGSYTVVVTNAAGSATSAAATLAVAALPPPAPQVVNLSSRGAVGTGDNILIAGFVVSGKSPKPLLIRAVGPTLAGFGVTGVMANPTLEVFAVAPGTPRVAGNDDWGSAANASAVASTAARVGAFPLNANSADAAVLVTLDPGAYTALVRGVAGGTGNAIVEIYDAEEGTSGSRLVNVATRCEVGLGDNVLIGGFVVRGATSKRVLVRAVGPALREFGLPKALSDPVLKVFRDGRAVAENDNWGDGDAAGVVAAANAAGAFAFAAGSRDAALVVTLEPGNYSVVVGGVAGATGTAMVEVYELPAP